DARRCQNSTLASHTRPDKISRIDIELGRDSSSQSTPDQFKMSKARAATDQIVKLIVGAGQASPSPPVGPALGSKGVKSMDLCKVRYFLTISEPPHSIADKGEFSECRNSMQEPPTSTPEYQFPLESPSALIDPSP